METKYLKLRLISSIQSHWLSPSLLVIPFHTQQLAIGFFTNPVSVPKK